MAVKLSDINKTEAMIAKLTKELKECDFVVEDYDVLNLDAQILTQKLYTAQNHLLQFQSSAIQLQNARASLHLQKGDQQ